MADYEEVVRMAQGALAHFERRGHAHELAPITDWIAALQAKVAELERLTCNCVDNNARMNEYKRSAEQAEAAFSVAPIVEIDNSGDEVRLIVEGSWLDNAVTGVRVGALHGKRVALVVIEDTPPTNTSPAIDAAREG